LHLVIRQCKISPMTILRKLVSLNVIFGQFFDRQFPGFVAEESFKDKLLSLINKIINERDFCSVLEVGGIDRPLLKRSYNIRYDGVDVNYKSHCTNIYDNFYTQSIEQPLENKYDLIMSMTVLEHVRDNNASITQIHRALQENGYTIHYLPSKYHPYSLALRIVGPKWQRKLIKNLRPWASDVTGYPAFFDKASPKQMRELFKSKGFKDIETISFFRANDYFRFFFPLYLIVTLWENICKKLKWVQLCSGFIIVAHK